MKSKLKNLFLSGITAFAVMLSGCAGLTEKSSANSPEGADMLYTAECEITVGGDEDKEEFIYGGSLNRLGGGMWEFDITSPETVKGLKIRLDEKGINASLGDLNFNLEKDKIPSRAAFLKIFAALDNAAANKNNLAFSETETNLCYSGNTGDEKYVLLCDKTKNYPCGLNIGKINVSFINFTVNGKAPESTETSPQSSETVTVTSAETTVTSVQTTTASPETTVTVSETTVTVSETTTAVTTEAPIISTPFFTTSTAATSE